MAYFASFVEALQAPVGRKRIQCGLPEQWSKHVQCFGNSSQHLSTNITDFASCEVTFDIQCALLSDPMWANAEARKQSLLGISVAVAKAILHFAYDIYSGKLQKKRIQECIAFSRFIEAETNLEQSNEALFKQFWTSYEHYEVPWESLVNFDGTISLWTLVRAFFAEWPLMFLVRTRREDPNDWPEDDADEAPFVQSFEYNMDGLKASLRVLMTLTTSIQRLHLDLLEIVKEIPNVEALHLSRKTIHENGKKKKNTLWSNYLFDLAAMWINIARLREAFIDHDKTKIRKAFHEARFWSRSSGLAQSSALLHELIKQPVLLNIAKLATFMHFLYLRIFSYLIFTLGHTKMSDLTLQWNFQNIGDIVFVYIGGTDRIVPDEPNVGTSVYECFRFYGETNLEPYHFGLGLPSMKDQLLGLEPEDLVILAFASHMSTRLCQSYPTIWGSLVDKDVWTPEMRKGLPTTEVIDSRFLKPLDQLTWIPEPNEFLRMNACSDQMYKDMHKKAQNEEIDKLMKELSL
jgi:hypothetical protein